MTIRPRAQRGVLVVWLGLAATALIAPSPAGADGRLGHPRATKAGTFAGIAFLQYDGIFKGRTSTGAYRVPYRITAPENPKRGNRTVVVEPPHIAGGLGMLENYLGRDLLLGQGFAHAGVGYGTASFGEGQDLGILDPTVPGVFIHGGRRVENGRIDREIVVDFARALKADRDGRAMLGRLERRYLTGFSDTANLILRLINSGQARGVFDLALPITVYNPHDPRLALASRRYRGKLMIVDSEFDPSDDLVDRGRSRRRYRFYVVAGTPHISDFLTPSFSNETTPASVVPALRAHFLQGDRWVRGGVPPPRSTHLKTSHGETLDPDRKGNAIAVKAGGRRVPRLPMVELGEARFIGRFIGKYDRVKTIEDLGFTSHDAYLAAFDDRLTDYVRADYILEKDARAMHRRAALCPPLTFTETYRDHYKAFTAIRSCGE